MIILKTLKIYGKTFLKVMGFIVLFAGILALFNSLDILFQKTTDVIIMIGMILVLFVIGFQYGKKATKKGFLEGLKIGGSLILLFIFINLIFYQTGFSLERIIYYVVLILSSTLGSMLGINRRH